MGKGVHSMSPTRDCATVLMPRPARLISAIVLILLAAGVLTGAALVAFHDNGVQKDIPQALKTRASGSQPGVSPVCPERKAQNTRSCLRNPPGTVFSSVFRLFAGYYGFASPHVHVCTDRRIDRTLPSGHLAQAPGYAPSHRIMGRGMCCRVATVSEH